MPRDPVFVSFTMNCAGADRGVGYQCPRTWSAAEASLEGFAQRLQEAELKGTLFVASDLCKRAGDTIRSLAAEGLEFGLLTDPRLEGFRGCLANYRIEQQKELINMGAVTLTGTLGRPVEAFRAGEFSANNDTAIVLCELGFRHTSFSLPERHVLGQQSNWRTAYPFAHHVDPLDVLHPGTLELYEVPVTSDFDKTTLNGQEDFTPVFLGTAHEDCGTNAEFLLGKHLARMKAETVHVKTLTCVSHNVQSYGEPDSPAAENLAVVIDTVRRLVDEHGLELVPATLAQIHDEADRLHKDGLHT